jgi:DNA-binding LacI/PurR family transcriptional regulator
MKSAIFAATLRDVALAAGVVPMTASRAINGSGYVSEGIRKRVLEAAEKLNYRPNKLARSLKRRRVQAVGIVLPDIANPFSAELVRGMHEVLEARGYPSFLTGTSRSVQQEEANLELLIDQRVEGLLIATRGTQLGDDFLSRILRQRVPLVTIGRGSPLPHADNVTADHKKGAAELVNHLIDLGHRKIAFIGARPHEAPKLRRYTGYRDALKKHKIPLNRDWVIGPELGPAYATQSDGYAAFLQLMRLKNRPTAVFARNDFAAIGALRAAHEMGLSVPDDVAIAGFDNIPLAEYITPPLTTVEQPIAEQGRQAAEFLLERMKAPDLPDSREYRFDCRLIVRASTFSCQPTGDDRRSLSVRA